jgi:hypothetical protein
MLVFRKNGQTDPICGASQQQEKSFSTAWFWTNQLAMFRQRQWSDRLYGVVRLLHQ